MYLLILGLLVSLGISTNAEQKINVHPEIHSLHFPSAPVEYTHHPDEVPHVPVLDWGKWDLKDLPKEHQYDGDRGWGDVIRNNGNNGQKNWDHIKHLTKYIKDWDTLVAISKQGDNHRDWDRNSRDWDRNKNQDWNKDRDWSKIGEEDKIGNWDVNKQHWDGNRDWDRNYDKQHWDGNKKWAIHKDEENHHDDKHKGWGWGWGGHKDHHHNLKLEILKKIIKWKAQKIAHSIH